MVARWLREGFNMIPRTLENGALASAPCTFCYIGLSDLVPLRCPSFLFFQSPEMVQDGPKKAKVGPKLAPRWPQDGPKMAPRDPKSAQDGLSWPKMASAVFVS